MDCWTSKSAGFSPLRMRWTGGPALYWAPDGTPASQSGQALVRARNPVLQAHRG
jgi:hypothetical protein